MKENKSYYKMKRQATKWEEIDAAFLKQILSIQNI